MHHSRRRLNVTRRNFLARSAAFAGAAALVASVHAAVEEPSAIPIVDTHQHLWDLERFRLPWLANAGPVLNRSYSMADYLKAAEGLNVVKAVYMEVAVDAAQRKKEAEYVIDLCKQKAGPTVAAVIGGAVEREDFADSVFDFSNSPYVKGVRSSFDALAAAGDVALTNLRLLGRFGMCFDLNPGPPGLARAAEVAAACPDTRFVLDHCGNVDAAVFGKVRPPEDATAKRTQWQRGIDGLAGRDNVVCKISGVMEAASGTVGDDEYAAVINHCLDRFGPDRVIFAGNWPVVNRRGSLGAWVKRLRSVVRDRPDVQQRKLFSDNALKFYALK
jgi:predicted TIM-barrel fold metal-dependent hydrolase